jgi:RNA-directed DNA polymerase
MILRAKPSVELTRDAEELKRLFFSLRTARDVANLLEIAYEHLIHILYRAPDRYPYRTFQIPKRSGGAREISAPPPSLGILQSKLNTVLQVVYPPKPSAHGFVTGRSIRSNAREHVGKRFVLNIDLEDFFPSINFGRVRGMFMAHPYRLEPAVATVLAQICCHNNQLPQGAPTSPILSNMVCARLDGELQRLAQKHRCMYTRYADDLTFSTTLRTFPEQLADPEAGWTGEGLALGQELRSVIESNGFRVNTRKQRLQFRNWRQDVTGLTVNKFPNVPRRFVRQVRAMLHAWERYGLEAAEQEFRQKPKYDRRSRRPDAPPPSFGRVLRGKLDFLKMVKGESDTTYRRLRNKLHALDPDLIGEAPEEPPAHADEQWSHYFEKYKNLVFHVVLRKDGDEFGGTAFVWRGRTLATAAHNLDGEVEVSPPLPEGQPVPASAIVFHPRRDEQVDVAVLQLPEGVGPLRGQIPVRTSPVNPGEQVAALGYPSIPRRQPALAILTGHVESRALNYAGTVDTVQVSIKISGGMSGGPVIDRGGRLVGIAMEQTFEHTEGGVPARAFHHVLPVRYLREIDVEQAGSGR